MESKIEDAVAEERKKWEKVVEGYNEAEQRYAERYDQVVQLQEQLAETKQKQREREARMEDEVQALVAKKLRETATKHADEMEYLRQECALKEASSAARVREVFEKQLRDMEEELANAKDKISVLGGLVSMVTEGASDNANADWLRDDVKRERRRTREVEKVVEKQTAEISRLKQEIVEAKQQQYKEGMENIQREGAGDAKAYKQLEQYQNENKSLRQQLQARDPNRIFELEAQLKVAGEESEKLRVEIKTLQAIIQRQEKAIHETQDIDTDCAQKVNHVVADLQVSRAETARVKEKLEQAEKNLKSRAKIEEGLRARTETAEKKAASMEKRLKEARGGGGELLATIDVQRAAATREELESLRRKCLALEQQREAERRHGLGQARERERLEESVQQLAAAAEEMDRLRRKVQVVEQGLEQERKQHAAVLKEKDKLVHTLQELSEQQQREMEASSAQARALALQMQQLKGSRQTSSGPSLSPKQPHCPGGNLEMLSAEAPPAARGGAGPPRVGSSGSARSGSSRVRAPSGGLQRLDGDDEGGAGAGGARGWSGRSKARSPSDKDTLKLNGGMERLDGEGEGGRAGEKSGEARQFEL